MRIDPSKRYSYLHGGLLIAVLEDGRELDGLMKHLDVPGKPGQLQRLSVEEKRAHVERQIAHLQGMKTSPWYEVDAPDVVAGCLWYIRRRHPDVRSVFGRARAESELSPPVAEWLRKNRGLVVYDEVPMGTKRCDLLGYRKGGWFDQDLLVGVELKKEIVQLKRGLDQMTTFKEYANEVYLACTTVMAVDYLYKHAEARSVGQWDPGVLDRKLSQVGIGLLIVHWTREGPVVDEVLKPKTETLKESKHREVVDQIKVRAKLG
jgi:hypothetical protein